MAIEMQRGRIQLCHRQALSLSDARGTRLRAVAGTSWVTIDHDRRDWVLEPGDELLVDSAARVLLTSLGPHATVDIAADAPQRSPRTGPLAWLGRAATLPPARAAAPRGAAA